MNWWQRNIVEPGKLPLLLCLIAFILTFLVTRTITRLIRAGKGPFRNVETEGGLHVHHAVPGVILLVLSAALAISALPASPWRAIAGVGIGIGASLVLDEFALILHLDDVYWEDEGRISVEMIALTTAVLGCVLLSFTPFGVNRVRTDELNVRLSETVVLLITIVAVAVTVLKGKYRLALFSVFVPLIAYVAACRLARPNSPWDRWRYGNHPERRARAAERTRRSDARWDPRFRRLSDLIAGSPDEDPSPST